MDENLINVLRSLVGVTITSEDASKYISKLIVASGEVPVLEPGVQIQGISQLAIKNIISQEQAISWSKVVVEKQMEDLIKPQTHNRLVTKERKSGKRPAGGTNQSWYKRGELWEGLVEGITQGHDTFNDLVAYMAHKSGYKPENIYGTVAGALSKSTKAGKLEMTIDDDGKKHYAVLEYDSAAQAGVGTGFQSRKQVEKELGN